MALQASFVTSGWAILAKENFERRFLKLEIMKLYQESEDVEGFECYFFIFSLFDHSSSAALFCLRFTTTNRSL